MKRIVYWTADMESSEAMILTVMNTVLAIAQRDLKNSGLYGVLTS